MSDPRLITDEELAALRKWRERWLGSDEYLDIDIIDAILARNPAPWEPSEDDITAYCEAFGWTPPAPNDRIYARLGLTAARKRGIEITFRRIEGES